MQRPRNRQNRPQQASRNNRRDNYGNGTRPSSAAVPRIGQVVPGAAASIILKVDQPTGKESQGFVAEVLTRGDHPRGIKVRLADGRVGRVQRMIAEDEAKSGSEGLGGLGRNGEVGPTTRASSLVRAYRTGGAGLSTSTSRFSHRYHDVRNEADASVPSEGYNLDDFLPAGHPLKEAQTASMEQAVINSTGGSMTHKCPVCGEFEGDEIAVSRHVDAHFE